jgi:hypothetical protein
MSKFKLSIVIFFIGAIFGGVSVFFMLRVPVGNEESIKTTQISGEKILHSNLKTSGSNIEFMTQAEGAGVIKTEIPKMMIPEAKAWMMYNHGVSVGIMYQYDFLVHQFRPTFMLGYSYRFSRVALNLGVCGSQNSVGGSVGGSYWF